ncbi:MAG TPA: hypothetical protein VG917_00170 [Patescibacteria group bacterium]|nr:hypothetical protein [Patescibacteria group bacterium]
MAIETDRGIRPKDKLSVPETARALLSQPQTGEFPGPKDTLFSTFLGRTAIGGFRLQRRQSSIGIHEEAFIVGLKSSDGKRHTVILKSTDDQEALQLELIINNEDNDNLVYASIGGRKDQINVAGSLEVDSNTTIEDMKKAAIDPEYTAELYRKYNGETDFGTIFTSYYLAKTEDGIVENRYSRRVHQNWMQKGRIVEL